MHNHKMAKTDDCNHNHNNEYVSILIENNDKENKTYKIYLCNDIGDAHHYIPFVEVLSQCEEDDDVIIEINSYGGYLTTMLMIINAMKNCKANITTKCSGMAASAASMILLAGDHIVIDPQTTTVMCHNYSGGAFGKGNEIKAQVEHQNIHYAKIMKKYYKGFLNKEEIVKLIEGKDYWISGKDLKKRLKKYIEYRQNQLAKRFYKEHIENKQQQIIELETTLSKLKSSDFTFEHMLNYVKTGQLPNFDDLLTDQNLENLNDEELKDMLNDMRDSYSDEEESDPTNPIDEIIEEEFSGDELEEEPDNKE